MVVRLGGVGGGFWLASVIPRELVEVLFRAGSGGGTTEVLSCDDDSGLGGINGGGRLGGEPTMAECGLPDVYTHKYE